MKLDRKPYLIGILMGVCIGVGVGYLIAVHQGLRGRGTDAVTKTALAEINALASDNFSAACINGIRDVEAKQLKLFAITNTETTAETWEGYSIEIVSNPDIIKNHRKWGGTYANHYNDFVLTFASAQIHDGHRSLGLHLARTLARIHPDLEWSDPSLGNRPIQAILKGLESDDGSMRDFLDAERIQWAWLIRTYGRPNQAMQADGAVAPRPDR